MTHTHDPDGTRLPIKIDSTSNGEFVPEPLKRRNVEGNDLAHIQVGENARRLGIDRRSFLVSVCGAATSLLAFNQINAAHNNTGGFFDIPADAALDKAVAAHTLEGREFIFDVQGHYVNPAGAWYDRMVKKSKGRKPYASFLKGRVPDAVLKADGFDYLKYLNHEAFIKDVFMDSDTDMMVLSFVPSAAAYEPVTIESADATRRIVDAMEGTQRMLLHGRVSPNAPGDIERMPELAERWGVSAWKCYTQFGPDGKGFFLDDDIGHAFIKNAIASDVKVICVHKGLPFGRRSYQHSLCRDIGVVARRYPEIDIIVYHSGYEMQTKEVAFEPGAGKSGVDSLIKSVIDNKIPKNSNVYAELGSTWRLVMQDPEQAAHCLGKLIKYLGADNVLWGTDSIWYGSPQDQIQAFRTFQISKQFQEKYGYPKITPEIRAKIFGLNATKPYKISAAEVQKRSNHDIIARQRTVYLERPNPSFLTYGPRTRRQFLALLKNGGA